VGRRLGRTLVVAGLFAFGLSYLAGPLAGSACAAETARSVELRFLLISGDGAEPSLRAWQAELSAEGVPFDTVQLTAASITAEMLRVDPDRGRYQAVVLANSRLLATDGTVGALDPEEQRVLAEYEVAFGVRQVVAFSGPVPGLGLEIPATPETIDGVVAQLTAPGAAVFPELAGPVPIEGAQGHPAVAVPGGGAEVLLTDPQGRALVASTALADGREQLLVLVNSAPTFLHTRLLGAGLVGWAAKRVHLGFRRSYLAVHIDDVFLPNFRWDVEADETSKKSAIRMEAADVNRAATWSRQRDLRLDMAFNAYGRTSALCSAAVRSKGSFGWINHTYSHTSFDGLPAGIMEDEIRQNLRWAEAHGIELDPRELITGAHSGLSNPELAAALASERIRVIASDASVNPASGRIGRTQTIPRYPTGLFYDVGTVEEEIDEYNVAVFAECRQRGTTCPAEPLTWPEIVTREARIILAHITANDPRPHYAHQSNLAEDGNLYPVFDEVLARYRAAFRTPLLQPTLSETGVELARQQRWAAAIGDGQVTASTSGGRITLASTIEVEAPLSGWTGGQSYGGGRSGWVRLVPGKALTLTVA